MEQLIKSYRECKGCPFDTQKDSRRTKEAMCMKCLSRPDTDWEKAKAVERFYLQQLKRVEKLAKEKITNPILAIVQTGLEPANYHLLDQDFKQLGNAEFGYLVITKPLFKDYLSIGGSGKPLIKIADEESNCIFSEIDVKKFFRKIYKGDLLALSALHNIVNYKTTHTHHALFFDDRGEELLPQFKHGNMIGVLSLIVENIIDLENIISQGNRLILTSNSIGALVYTLWYELIKNGKLELTPTDFQSYSTLYTSKSMGTSGLFDHLKVAEKNKLEVLLETRDINHHYFQKGKSQEILNDVLGTMYVNNLEEDRLLYNKLLFDLLG